MPRIAFHRSIVRRKTGFVVSGTLAAALLSVVLGAPAAAQTAAAAASATPFGEFRGTWSGSGTLTLQSGESERLRCHATYQVEPDGTSMTQSLQCSSDSYRFDLRAAIRYEAGAVRGTWTEVTRTLQGNINGQSRGNEIRAVAEGNSFSAAFSIATRGKRQTVSIRSPGTELSQVSITLDRRG